MRATTLASLVVMLGCLGIEAADAQNYTLTDLGNLGGKIVSASAISNNGIVVGQSSIAGNDGSSFVFEWKNGVITKLDGLDSTFSQAYGVNSAGEVVGFTLDAHDLGRAFLYSDGVFSFPAGSSESSAYGINESGEVVGGYDPNVAAEQPFIYSDGMLATIAVNGAASAINNAGQVVGGTYSGEAFLYADGVITNLGQVSAQAINDKSQIIGGNGLSCYLSTDGKRKTLGSLYPKGPCHALALNNVGTVVGSAGVKNSNRYHAFIYKDGAFSDLNSMVVGPLKPYVVLGLASGINDSGQIAATGDDSRHPDEIHAYLVSPVLPLAIACPAAAAKVGTVYDSRPVVTGGVEPYTFSIVEGTLPNGLSLDFNTGAIIGTPTTVAKYQFEIQVTDSSQTADGTATQTCSIDVTQGHPPPALTAMPSHLSFGTVDHYSSQIKEVTLRNIGSTAIQLSQAVITPGAGTRTHDFSAIDECNRMLAPGASCTIYAVFVSEQAGSLSATLMVPSSASQPPVAVGLSALVSNTELETTEVH